MAPKGIKCCILKIRSKYVVPNAAQNDGHDIEADNDDHLHAGGNGGPE